jgi:hypothetical protein
MKQKETDYWTDYRAPLNAIAGRGVTRDVRMLGRC